MVKNWPSLWSTCNWTQVLTCQCFEKYWDSKTYLADPRLMFLFEFRIKFLMISGQHSLKMSCNKCLKRSIAWKYPERHLLSCNWFQENVSCWSQDNVYSECPPMSPSILRHPRSQHRFRLLILWPPHPQQGFKLFWTYAFDPKHFKQFNIWIQNRYL